MIIPVGPEGGNQVLCRVQKVSILLQFASCGVLSAIRVRDISLSPLAVIPLFSVALTRSSLSLQIKDQGPIEETFVAQVGSGWHYSQGGSHVSKTAPGYEQKCVGL